MFRQVYVNVCIGMVEFGCELIMSVWGFQLNKTKLTQFAIRLQLTKCGIRLGILQCKVQWLTVNKWDLICTRCLLHTGLILFFIILAGCLNWTKIKCSCIYTVPYTVPLMRKWCSLHKKSLQLHVTQTTWLTAQVQNKCNHSKQQKHIFCYAAGRTPTSRPGSGWARKQFIISALCTNICRSPDRSNGCRIDLELVTFKCLPLFTT